ncbi:MAG: AAA family ATPase [Planctomycetota bacterium]|nr:MAG: AAA family ATPase [Planctomycetota bacterium]
MDIEQQARSFQETLIRLRDEIAKVIVGHQDIIEKTIIGFVAGGHVLLEGVPGLGKTLLVRTLADAVSVQFSRIQFTPDLMPADITGTNIVVEEDGRRRFEFQKGPIFGNIILADEINRATPKTQSALLEAMQEGSVTLAGKRMVFEQPFFVLATQNPIEMEGTYPLPEAQLDRFMFKLDVKSPSVQELAAIFGGTTGSTQNKAQSVVDGKRILEMRALARQVPVAQHLLEYVARLVLATHPASPEGAPVVKQFVRVGSSPRGGQAIINGAKLIALMKGRYNVSADDIRDCARPALRHRLILNFEGEAEGIKPDDVVGKVIEHVPDIPERVRRM